MDHQERIKNMSVEELVNTVIWESVMENTAHCGWTINAREGLVRQVQDSVKWALETKGVIKIQETSK